MATAAGPNLGRLTTSDTALFVCDIQERFRDIIVGFPTVVDTARRMIRGATIFGMPIIVTEQYPRALGKTVPELLEVLPADALVVEKTRFSMVVDKVADFLRERDDIKRVILVGIEGHVCVLQTVLDLIERNKDVHVLTDAVSSSTELHRQTGLHRAAQAGAFLSTSEMVCFQIMGDTSYPNFKAVSALFKETKPQPLPGF